MNETSNSVRGCNAATAVCPVVRGERLSPVLHSDDIRTWRRCVCGPRPARRRSAGCACVRMPLTKTCLGTHPCRRAPGLPGQLLGMPCSAPPPVPMVTKRTGFTALVRFGGLNQATKWAPSFSSSAAQYTLKTSVVLRKVVLMA